MAKISSNRIKEKKKKLLQKRIIVIGSLALILMVGSVFTARAKRLQIEKIEIGGNKILESEKILSLMTEPLKGNYLALYPRSNILIYPKAKIISGLKNEIKRIKDISIRRTGFNTLMAEVSEYDSSYLWCIGAGGAGEVPEKCFFLDAEGYAFDNAPYFSGGVYFKFYAESGEEAVGRNILPADEFKNIVEFKNFVADLGLRPYAILIDHENYELLLEPEDDAPAPRILFNKGADYGKVYENLAAALAADPLVTDFKKKYSSLIYIDLRFGNKVYYKFE